MFIYLIGHYLSELTAMVTTGLKTPIILPSVASKFLNTLLHLWT